MVSLRHLHRSITLDRTEPQSSTDQLCCSQNALPALVGANNHAGPNVPSEVQAILGRIAWVHETLASRAGASGAGPCTTVRTIDIDTPSCHAYLGTVKASLLEACPKRQSETVTAKGWARQRSATRYQSYCISVCHKALRLKTISTRRYPRRPAATDSIVTKINETRLHRHAQRHKDRSGRHSRQPALVPGDLIFCLNHYVSACSCAPFGTPLSPFVDASFSASQLVLSSARKA